MDQEIIKTIKSAKQHKPAPTISAQLENGALVEMVYDPAAKQTAFVLWQDDKWSGEAGVDVSPTSRLIPYSPQNNLVKHEVVLFPSSPQEYGTEQELLDEIQSFIH